MSSTYENIKKKISQIDKTAKRLNDAFMYRDAASINASYASLTKECVDLTNYVGRDACSNSPNARVFSDTVQSIVSVSADQDDDITHIHVSDHLPVRVKRVQNDGNIIENLYSYPITKALKESGASRYMCKVMILFSFNFGQSSELIDLDNFFLKPIIDTIKNVLLADDSPEHVNYVMESTVQESVSTDIYLVPYERFGEWYVNRTA